MEGTLNYQKEYSIAAVRPDLILSYPLRMFPFGIVEIKLPDQNIMKSKSMWGQTYDYLRVLHEKYGVKQPFGIMTTYKEWRFCWLPESDTS